MTYNNKKKTSEVAQFVSKKIFEAKNNFIVKINNSQLKINNKTSLTFKKNFTTKNYYFELVVLLDWLRMNQKYVVGTIYTDRHNFVLSLVMFVISPSNQHQLRRMSFRIRRRKDHLYGIFMMN